MLPIVMQPVAKCYHVLGASNAISSTWPPTTICIIDTVVVAHAPCLSPVQTNSIFTILRPSRRSFLTQLTPHSPFTDYAWDEIRNFAEETLAAECPVPTVAEPLTKKPPKKLTRSMSTRFSFTRSVSREIYERQNSRYVHSSSKCLFDHLNSNFSLEMQNRSQLTDGATPIVIIDTDEILETLQRATRMNGAAAAAASERERIQNQSELYDTDSTDEASN